MSLFGSKDHKDTTSKVAESTNQYVRSEDPPVYNKMAQSGTYLSKNSTLTGELESAGDISIDGRLEGNIHCGSKFVLGASAVVEGNVFTQYAEISGEVTGKVEVKELLTLKSTAIIHGDINTGKLIIEAGAKFNGNCKMGVVSKEVTLSEKTATAIAK